MTTKEIPTVDEYFYETTDCKVTADDVTELPTARGRFVTRHFATNGPSGHKKTRKWQPGCAPKYLWDSEGKLYLIGFNGPPTKAQSKLGMHHDEHGVYLRREDRPPLRMLERWLPKKAYQDTLSCMVPASSWGASLHRLLSDADWQSLREQTFTACGHHCEICGSGEPLECHEVWSYHEPSYGHSQGVQRLEKLVGLCHLCHETQHLGFAKRAGRLDQALARLAQLNDWTADQVSEHYRDCVNTFLQRSEVPWMLDLGRLDAPVTIRPGWRIEDELWLSTTGRSGVVKTKLLSINWNIAGQSSTFKTKLKITVFRNVPLT